VSALFDLVVVLLLLTTALSVARARDLLAAVVTFALYSLVLSLLWQHRGAPDVALTEAAVGAGVTSALFLVTIARLARRGSP